MISNTPLWLRNTINFSDKCRYDSLENPKYRKELRNYVEKYKKIILSERSELQQKSILMNTTESDIENYAKIKAIFELYRGGSRDEQIIACEYIRDLLMIMSVEQMNVFYAPILSCYISDRVNQYLNQLDDKGRERNLSVVSLPSHLEMWFAFVYANADLDRSNAGKRSFLDKEERKCNLNSKILQSEPDLETLRLGVMDRIEELKGLNEENRRGMEVDEPNWLAGCFDEDTKLFQFMPQSNDLDIQIIMNEDVMMIDEKNEDNREKETYRLPRKRKLDNINIIQSVENCEEKDNSDFAIDHITRPTKKIRLNNYQTMNEQMDIHMRTREVYSDFNLEIQSSNIIDLEEFPDFEPFGKGHFISPNENDISNPGDTQTGTELEQLLEFLDSETILELLSSGVRPEDLLIQFRQEQNLTRHIDRQPSQPVNPTGSQPDRRRTSTGESGWNVENLNDEQMLQRVIRESMESDEETKTQERPPVPLMFDPRDELSGSEWDCEDDDPGSECDSQGAP